METGSVSITRSALACDVGKAINPVNVEGQMEGGAAQAIGWSVMEESILERGVMNNAAFHNYLIPTSRDLPLLESIIVECPNELGPFGAKGVGRTAHRRRRAGHSERSPRCVGISHQRHSADRPAGASGDKDAGTMSGGRTMSATRFFAPDSLEDALRLLAEYRGGAVVVNGGTDIVEKIAFDRIRPEAVVYIGNIRSLCDVERRAGYTVIGGGVVYADILRSPLCAPLTRCGTRSRKSVLRPSAP